MENQANGHIEELNYLDAMSEKALEVLTKNLFDKEFPISEQEPFPADLMGIGSDILVRVAANNTPIRGFHVAPLVEGHLFMLNVQDKNNNTVGDVIFVCEIKESSVKVLDIVVNYKPGAILHFYEELEKNGNEQEMEVDPV